MRTAFDGRGGVQREDLLLVAVHVADLGPVAICILVFDLAVDDRVTALFRLDEAELLGLAGLGVGDGEGGVGLDTVAAGGLHPEERAVVTVDDGLRIDVLMPCRAPTPFVLTVASEGVGVTLPLVLALTKESSACTVGRTMTRPPRAGLLRW